MIDLAGGLWFGLPLSRVWFGLLYAILGTFLFLDGFDFGAGVFFATANETERETILAAIGPFWDGNEVWLVVFGGALFAVFPTVYAELFSRHYLLMFGILGALILRGLAPEMYEQRHDASWRRWWGRSFVSGSLLAPFLLGMFVGNWVAGRSGSVTFVGGIVGFTLVALTLVSGAAFLGVKTRGGLQDRMRQYGIRALTGYLILVIGTLGTLASTTSIVADAVTSLPVFVLVGVSVLFAGGYVLGFRHERYRLALAASAGLTYSLVAVVAVVQYPFIDPVTRLTLDEGIVSQVPLKLLSVGIALLLPLVVLYFVVLYTAFSGPATGTEAY